MLANKLNYGDTIGVVGVANSLELHNRYEDFYRAEKFFESKGFKIKRGKYVLENYYGTAGTREQKAEDLMNMFKDEAVKAIICLEGGQNCNTFIDLLDYDVIRQNPKIITGYSDVTVLLQTIYNKTGLVTFHGSTFVCFGGMMYLLGTEYLPDMKDNILLIESYRTSPNECQRRFAHLKQYGMFGKVKGIVVGYNYDLQKKWRCISTNGGYIVGIYKRI